MTASLQQSPLGLIRPVLSVVAFCTSDHSERIRSITSAKIVSVTVVLWLCSVGKGLGAGDMAA